jgi:Protein of unknown function (DUF3551)
MVRMILAVVATVSAVLVFGLQPAAAYEAPWCAVIAVGTGNMYWDCQYRSIEECRPNVLAGNRGFCNPNPRFVAGPTKDKRSGKRRTHPQ